MDEAVERPRMANSESLLGCIDSMSDGFKMTQHVNIVYRYFFKLTGQQ